MVESARVRTKVYLEAYLTAAYLLKDDGSTQAPFIVTFGRPNYALTRVFKEREVDIVFSIGEPESKALYDTDQSPCHYEEHVPITVFCIDKPDATGVKLKWQGEAELRRIVETYPTGSQRGLERRGDKDVWLGSDQLYATEFILNYVRDTT